MQLHVHGKKSRKCGTDELLNKAAQRAVVTVVFHLALEAELTKASLRRRRT